MIDAPPPVLTPLKPCYVSVQSAQGTYTSEPLQLGGSGFGPGERLSLSIDDQLVLDAVAATDTGVLPAQTLSSPVQAGDERPFTVTVRRAGTATIRASASAYVTELAVDVRPQQARPQQRVRFTGQGFTDSGPIYAHYVRKNVLRRTVRLASAPVGACGHFTAKRPQFPFRPSEGVWRIQIDQHADLGTEGPLVNLAVDVRRRPVTQP